MASSTTTDRVFNFSAGPAVLPVPVLERVQQELLCLPGVGSSILEISHRSPAFEEIHNRAIESLETLLQIPESHQVLFLQGGSRLQFSMVPMNLLQGRSADYLVTGSWGQSSLAEARNIGAVEVVWDGSPHNFDRVPDESAFVCNENAAYLHFTSNETIQGVQFAEEPVSAGVPLVCDSSSDFLSRPVDVEKYGLIYACAQKNAGPAGVTVVIIDKELLIRSSADLPGYLNYDQHAQANSLYNTPPTFAIYVVGLVAQWLLDEIGGLAAMEAINGRKAAHLYAVIDGSDGFYQGHALPESRSMMNVAFRTADPETDKQFLEEAARHQLIELKGHRSVGGMRASVYNAMPEEGVSVLADFMKDFARRHHA